MSDTSIRIRVYYYGWLNGVRKTGSREMEAEPEESLVSIVDRVETGLDDFRVKSIEIVEEQR